MRRLILVSIVFVFVYAGALVAAMFLAAISAVKPALAYSQRFADSLPKRVTAEPASDNDLMAQFAEMMSK